MTRMNSKQQAAAVFAVCCALVISAVIMSNQPQASEPVNTFKFPSGIAPSLGTFATTASGEGALNAIVVSGTGSASDKADKATLTLGVYTEDESASQAAEDNDVAMIAVLDAVKALGVLEDDIETVTYSVYPNYNWERKETTGYRVTNMVRISLDDLNIVGDVLDAATNAGANQVQGISFGLSEDKIDALKTEAYIDALETAQVKADLIAETYKVSITGIYYVTENSYSPYRDYAISESAMSDSSPTPILEGSLSVSVSIQAAFTFE